MGKGLLVPTVAILCFLSACTKECENGEGCDKLKLTEKNNKLTFKNTGVEIFTIVKLSVYGADSAGYAYSHEVDKNFVLSGGLSKSFSKSELNIEETSQFPQQVTIWYKGSSCGSYSVDFGGFPGGQSNTVSSGYGSCTLLNN